MNSDGSKSWENSPIFYDYKSAGFSGWLKALSFRSDVRRLVFTNGCFDLIHSGHIKLFSWIKENWPDSLTVIGLNSDESVRRLKGAGRPLNSLKDRAAVLSAMWHIDAVCVFGEDTPAEIIQVARPDVLVKGGDYRDKKLVGEDFVLSYGGIVEKGPYMPGISTTELICRAYTSEER